MTLKKCIILLCCVLFVLAKQQCAHFEFPALQSSEITASEGATVTIAFRLNTTQCARERIADFIITISKKESSNEFTPICNLRLIELKCLETLDANSCKCTENAMTYSFTKTVDRSDNTNWTWWMHPTGLADTQEITFIIGGSEKNTVALAVGVAVPLAIVSLVVVIVVIVVKRRVNCFSYEKPMSVQRPPGTRTLHLVDLLRRGHQAAGQDNDIYIEIPERPGSQQTQVHCFPYTRTLHLGNLERRGHQAAGQDNDNIYTEIPERPGSQQSQGDGYLEPVAGPPPLPLSPRPCRGRQ